MKDWSMTEDVNISGFTLSPQSMGGEIVLFQPDESLRLEVRLEDETVWLTQAQMAELFMTTPQNVTFHIGNIYKEEELPKEPTCKESLQVQQEGNRTVRGKKWIAIMKMNDMTATQLLSNI